MRHSSEPSDHLLQPLFAVRTAGHEPPERRFGTDAAARERRAVLREDDREAGVQAAEQQARDLRVVRAGLAVVAVGRAERQWGGICLQVITSAR